MTGPPGATPSGQLIPLHTEGISAEGTSGLVTTGTGPVSVPVSSLPPAVLGLSQLL